MSKLCKNCGSQNYNSLQKYCSDKCRKESGVKVKKVYKCVICKDNDSLNFLGCCSNDECRTIYAMSIVEKKRLADQKKVQIKKVSEKRKLENIIYQSERIKFLMLPENKVCPITKQQTTDIHHKKGRIGSLYLDKKYWIALSREGHKFVEENPKWAKENGYSLNRLSND